MTNSEGGPTSLVDRDSVKGSSITRLLPCVLIGLVLTASLPIIVLGYIGARDNTTRLLRDRAELTINSVVSRIATHLDPPRHQLRYIQSVYQQRSHKNVGSTQADMGDFIVGALAATPQVTGIGHVLPNRSMRRYNRSDFSIYFEDSARVPAVDESLAAARDGEGIQWLSAVRSPILQETILRLVAPLRDTEDRFQGALIAAVKTSALSEYLKQLRDQGNPVAFILTDTGRVVAHPSLTLDRIDKNKRSNQPLPALDAIGDPVLAKIWTGERKPLSSFAPFRHAKGHWVWVNNESYAFVYQKVEGFGANPWTVGVYFPGSETRRERWIVMGVGLGGGVFLCFALAAAIFIGRQLGQPILSLAKMANRIEALEFDSVQAQPQGLIREVNLATTAFERTAAGLRLFETYVPRNLVRRLVAAGSKQPLSETRELTIMFTDLEGYSSFSLGREAPEIAAYLNDMLACIGPQIETTSGTIDNFMGDGVMAFWGAPEAQANHANLACRAALGIAEAISRENVRRLSASLPKFRLRIGLHTGSVVVGNIGFEGRVHYTIIGEAANVAQRIEQLGREVDQHGDDVVTLVSSQIYKATSDFFRFASAFDRPGTAALQSAAPIFRLMSKRDR